MEINLGESEVCDMTLMSGALDISLFDGITTLLLISEEYDKHRYVYIGGHMTCSFQTNDIIYRYVSNLGNNLTTYSIAMGEENIFFYLHFLFLLKEKRSMIMNCRKQIKVV